MSFLQYGKKKNKKVNVGSNPVLSVEGKHITMGCTEEDIFCWASKLESAYFTLMYMYLWALTFSVRVELLVSLSEKANQQISGIIDVQL